MSGLTDGVKVSHPFENLQGFYCTETERCSGTIFALEKERLV